MSSLRYLRSFINERLTAAAEEIFTEFEKVTVQYEEVIDGQRGLLEASNWLKTTFTPQIKIQRIDILQQHNLKEKEIPTDPYQQDESSSLGQGVQVPPHFKDELQEVGISQHGEQVELKEEADSFTMTSVYEEGFHNEAESLLDQDEQVPQSIKEDLEEMWINQHEEQRQIRNVYTFTTAPVQDTLKDLSQQEVHAEQHIWNQDEGFSLDLEELRISQPVYEESQQSESFTHQHLPSSCPATESGDLMGSSHVEAGSVTDSEQKTETSLRADMKTADLTPLPSNLHDFSTATKSLTCDVCGKTFMKRCSLKYHSRIHAGIRNHACTVCQKTFYKKYHLICHIRTHTGEKPYSCQLCGKCFTANSNLSQHIKTHSSEKPYSCQKCCKNFKQKRCLASHLKTHV